MLKGSGNKSVLLFLLLKCEILRTLGSLNQYKHEGSFIPLISLYNLRDRNCYGIGDYKNVRFPLWIKAGRCWPRHPLECWNETKIIVVDLKYVYVHFWSIRNVLQKLWITMWVLHFSCKPRQNLCHFWLSYFSRYIFNIVDAIFGRLKTCFCKVLPWNNVLIKWYVSETLCRAFFNLTYILIRMLLSSHFSLY